jgi:hypothetical protein
LLLGVSLFVGTARKVVDIRIVGGVEPEVEIIPTPPAAPIATAQPEPPRGTAEMYDLYGRCFKVEVGVFEYSFCPFLNMTQRDTGTNGFWGVLGMYHGWDSSLSNFTRMLFHQGYECGGIKRSGQVEFSCGDSAFEVHDIQEPNMCNYTMKLRTPFACGSLDVANEAPPPDPLVLAVKAGAAHPDSIPRKCEYKSADPKSATDAWCEDNCPNNCPKALCTETCAAILGT